MPVGPLVTITPCGTPQPFLSGLSCGARTRNCAPDWRSCSRHAAGSTDAALSHCGERPPGNGLLADRAAAGGRAEVGLLAAGPTKETTARNPVNIAATRGTF